MEQKPLHDSINFKLPSYGQPIAAAMVPGLLCPSSPTLGDTAASYHGYGVTNYSACEGHELGRYDYPWGDDTAAAIDCAGLVSADYSGIFTVLESNRFADVSDGTSTTVALAETSSVGFKNGGRHGEFKGVIRQVTPGEAVFRSAFIAGMHWGEGAAAPYVRPDGAAPVYGTWFRAAPYMMHPAYITHFHINSEFYGADSAHPLTVNVAMADGSVRTLSQTMDYFTWVIINGKRDGQPTKTEY